jgi:hypothetical protein
MTTITALVRPLKSGFAFLSWFVFLLSGCSVPGDRIANNATLVEQQMCSTQANKYFDQYYGDADRKAAGVFRSGQTSHYDPRSRTCYIEIEAQSDPINFKTIENAFGGQSYGLIRYTDKAIMACSIHPPDQAQINCRSEEEFDNLALKYFGTTSDH